jgi:hypothetical protein
LKNLLIRRHRATLTKEQPQVARAQDLGSRYQTSADIHFSVIPREDRTKNVLIMFEPRTGEKARDTDGAKKPGR